MLRLFVVAFLAALAPCQTVRVANLTASPFQGWKRTTIDVLPPHLVGQVGATTYVVGRRTGLDVHVVDLHVTLQPFQEVAFDLANGAPIAWTRAPLSANPMAPFGGSATIGGVPLGLVAVDGDGAGYSFHLRARKLPLLVVDLWFTWYPDQPGFCQGEVALIASNPTIPDLEVIVPPGMVLTLGTALVVPLGGSGPDLLPSGLTLADGQSRLLPVTFAWPAHLASTAAWLSAGAVASLGIGAVGITRLHVDGNPIYPPGFSARQWAAARWQAAIAGLHTMDGPVCGPNILSAVAGHQEDQTFVRGEALLADGVGAEHIAYLSALKLGGRPCHHLEEDGRPLDLPLHVNPRLVFWDGRAHWSPVVSPDRLGKTGQPTLTQTKGWWGPDVEHWLMNTLAAAVRLTGSPACQWLLAHQARIYLLQSTTTPGLATSAPFASRAVGWEGMLAVHLWRELEDRSLAADVRLHWQDRVTTVILPAYGNRPDGVWDPRLDDPRFGKGWWWSPWQQAVGAYGLDLGCAVLGPPAGRAVARAAATTVLRRSFVLQNGIWQNHAAVALDGRFNASPIFYLFGTPLAVAVVLRHDPQHAVANAIWSQMRSAATSPVQFSWFAPGL